MLPVCAAACAHAYCPLALAPWLPSPAGSGRTSPAAALASANPALTTRRPGSDTGSPLGRYGAVGSPSSQGAASSIGAAAEEALAAKLAATGISGAGAGAGIDLPPSTASASHVSVLSASPGDAMLPPGWAKVTDGQGLVYYVNHVTQEVRGWARGRARAGREVAGAVQLRLMCGCIATPSTPVAARRPPNANPLPLSTPHMQSSLTRPSAQGQAAM